MPKGEPRTEQEAQEMKKFLETGGDVKLEPVQTSKAAAGSLMPTAALSLQLLDVSRLLDSLPTRIDGEGGKVTEGRTFLELEFQPSQVLPNYSVHVFLNNPGANERTAAEDASFVGSVSFWCHAQLVDGEPVCMDHSHEKPTIYRLPVAEAALKSAGPLIVTLVPVPYAGRRPIAPLAVEAKVVAARSEFVAPSA